jgi:hypothetical protein
MAAERVYAKLTARYWCSRHMNTYERNRFPRDIEDLLAERGISVKS